MKFSENSGEFSAFDGAGKSGQEVIEEQQRIMDAAQQNLKPRNSLHMKSSSLDNKIEVPVEILSQRSKSSAFTEGNVAGVNPVYEFKYNRPRGIVDWSQAI